MSSHLFPDPFRPHRSRRDRPHREQFTLAAHDVTDHSHDHDETYPLGTLAYAEVTANQTGISGETVLTGLQVTVDVGDGSRRIRVSAHGRVIQRTSSAGPAGRIKESTTQLQFWLNEVLGVDEVHVGSGSVVLTPSAGEHTYTLTLATGSGTVDLLAASTHPAFILVEDIGPA